MAFFLTKRLPSPALYPPSSFPSSRQSRSSSIPAGDHARRPPMSVNPSPPPSPIQSTILNHTPFFFPLRRAAAHSPPPLPPPHLENPFPGGGAPAAPSPRRPLLHPAPPSLLLSLRTAWSQHGTGAARARARAEAEARRGEEERAGRRRGSGGGRAFRGGVREGKSRARTRRRVRPRTGVGARDPRQARLRARGAWEQDAGGGADPLAGVQARELLRAAGAKQ